MSRSEVRSFQLAEPALRGLETISQAGFEDARTLGDILRLSIHFEDDAWVELGERLSALAQKWTALGNEWTRSIVQEASRRIIDAGVSGEEGKSLFACAQARNHGESIAATLHLMKHSDWTPEGGLQVKPLREYDSLVGLLRDADSEIKSTYCLIEPWQELLGPIGHEPPSHTGRKLLPRLSESPIARQDYNRLSVLAVVQANDDSEGDEDAWWPEVLLVQAVCHDLTVFRHLDRSEFGDLVERMGKVAIPQSLFEELPLLLRLRLSRLNALARGLLGGESAAIPVTLPSRWAWDLEGLGAADFGALQEAAALTCTGAQELAELHELGAADALELADWLAHCGCCPSCRSLARDQRRDWLLDIALAGWPKRQPSPNAKVVLDRAYAGVSDRTELLYSPNWMYRSEHHDLLKSYAGLPLGTEELITEAPWRNLIVLQGSPGGASPLTSVVFCRVSPVYRQPGRSVLIRGSCLGVEESRLACSDLAAASTSAEDLFRPNAIALCPYPESGVPVTLRVSISNLEDSVVPSRLELHWYARSKEAGGRDCETGGVVSFASAERQVGVAVASLPWIPNADIACAIVDKPGP